MNEFYLPFLDLEGNPVNRDKFKYPYSIENLENFLRDYFDNPNLRLIAMMEGCNVSNGYPYYLFIFNKN
jgi:hypothetical protein